jgi:hypothetical protein
MNERSASRARQCTQRVLVIAALHSPKFARRYQGGLHHGAPEASFEAKGSQDNPAGIRRRWDVSGDGGRRISGNRADGECTIARHRAASRHFSRRGGTFRRQPGDVLRLRQGKRPARRRPEARSTRRLRRLRRLQRLRSTRLRGLRRLRSTRLRSTSLRRLRRRLRSTSLPRLRRLWRLQGLRSTGLERVRRVWRLRLRLRVLLAMVRLRPDLGLLERA